jgi:FAD-dependent urate hydroxylase
VRGLRRARLDVTVAAAASARPAPAHWSRAASQRIVTPHPLDDEEGFIAAVARAAGSERYAVLMPGSDASLLAISRARDRLAPDLLLGLPSHEVVLRSLDKLELGSVASRHALASPSTRVCEDEADAIAAAGEYGFPVVVKPTCAIIERDGSRHQFGGRHIGDPAGLRRAVSECGGRCLVQRAESGPVLSFGGVFAGGRLLGEAVSRYWRTWYPEAGNVSYSETIDRPELAERVTGLLAEIGWEGLFELEVIERGGQEWAAIDFNPRPYGSLALAIGAGANLPAVWCSHLLGRQPSPVRAQPGRFYRWEDADLRHALWQLQHGSIGAALGVMRVRPKVVHPYLQARDPGPFLARAVFMARSVSSRRRNVAEGVVSQDVRDPANQSGLRRRRGARPGGPVVVLGAGPYGLSVAAHLQAAGLEVRCFGRPLEFWRENMPAGMILRSRRRATHIADPYRELTIDEYERSEGKAVRDPSLLLNEFIDYGMWFQRRAVPDLDERFVHSVGREGGGFRVRLEDGEELEASRVVVAAGLSPFASRPAPFASLPQTLVSHASDHDDLSFLSGRRVAVIGAGQSALESAALLSEQGAVVDVLARAGAISWLADDTLPAVRPLVPVPLPPTGVGGRLTGWVAAVPDLFRRLPSVAKPWTSYRCIAPAGSGWLRPRLGEVTISCGRSVTQAQSRAGSLRLVLDDGSERLVDHVLLGTGYQIDVRRYRFLEPDLGTQLQVVGGYPRLGPGLESSVPGLHFVGAPAAYSFGPVMRFVVGSWYAAPAVTLRAVGRRQRPVRFAF